MTSCSSIGDSSLVIRKSRTSGLKRFISADQPSEAVFRATYRLRKGQLNFNIPLEDGHVTKPICGLGTGFVDIEIKQETAENGKRSCILTIKYLAKPERKPIIYLLSTREPEGWHILEDFQPLSGVGKYIMTRFHGRTLGVILQQGLNGFPTIFEVPLTATADGSKFLYHALFPGNIVRALSICSFGQRRSAVLALTEEDNEIIASFYEKDTQPLSREQAIKVAALSKKLADGIYQPYETAHIIKTEPRCSFQARVILINDLFLFLKEDAPVGAYFDLSRPVVPGQDGRITLTLDGQSVRLPDYDDYIGQSLYGRIVVSEKEKQIFFWLTEEARNNGETQPVSEGALLAQKQPDNSWEIQYFTGSNQARQRNRASRIFTHFLTSNNPIIIHEGPWPIKRRISNNCNDRAAYRSLGNGKIYVPIPLPLDCDLTEVHVVTREFAGRIKFAEFWQKRADYLSEQPALTARILATKLSDREPWVTGCFSLRNDRVRYLVKAGLLTRKVINDFVCHPYMLKRYPTQVSAITDHLQLWNLQN
jgi:hypothetical protein